jgi:hypothetical protein
MIIGVSAYLKTAGLSVTTVDITVKGNPLNAAITFQAGEKGHKEFSGFSQLQVTKGEELVIRITAAGSGAAGLKYNLHGTI